MTHIKFWKIYKVFYQLLCFIVQAISILIAIDFLLFLLVLIFKAIFYHQLLINAFQGYSLPVMLMQDSLLFVHKVIIPNLLCE